MLEHEQVTGDHLGLPIPATAAALRESGEAFLTNAFHAFGALAPDNRVVRIDRCQELRGGSTGRKLLLDVAYAHDEPGLRTDLFVKFSRDLDDPARDRGRTQMASEVVFAALSRTPGFPIAIPRPRYGDYHAGTGTGILITDRIPFGRNGVERQYEKCLDEDMPAPAEHYRALITALARLAGTQRSGRLPAEFTQAFPVDLRAATVGDPVTLSPERLQRRLTRLAEFADTHPGLLPPDVRTPGFLTRLSEEAHEVLRREESIWRALHDADDHIALCHWNANVDNAWFWRDDAGVLQCGLMDWGCVSRLNLAMALWGALCAADTTLWDHHFDELLELFCAEMAGAGGPRPDPVLLRRHLMLYMALMGITWLLDVPARIGNRLPGADADTTRHDPRIRGDEGLRAPLQMFTNMLNLWRTEGLARHLEALG
ncbi:hypothetical protein AU196_19770 [Mycobacterium sp. IS-1742]|uniref:hypothetical protein n=1 Tax=Mycobacterium sp. IS-1742 TaxID=1772285 RepID=UPI00073FD749|nr:hypothetical protein [Mycobacterium sp. IS-1742]KUI27569.1 hypothetical protein AU196_19770 [Mycobacterium sp. IS-1742]